MSGRRRPIGPRVFAVDRRIETVLIVAETSGPAIAGVVTRRDSSGVLALRAVDVWRYKLVGMDRPGREQSQVMDAEARLNALGAEGWEAVTVIEHGDGWWVLLKMPHEVASF